MVRLIAAALFLATSLGVSAPVYATTGWTVHAVVSPATMRYDTEAALTIIARAGARCMAVVVYANGKRPTSARRWAGVWLALPRGIERLTWREETKSNGGTAVVHCMYGGLTKTAIASFAVQH